MEIASVFTSKVMKFPVSPLKHRCWCRLRKWNLGSRLLCLLGVPSNPFFKLPCSSGDPQSP